MKSTSKMIIGAALIMAISLAVILGLLLVLLAELYCSLLPRRRQLQHTSSAATTTTTASTTNSAVENTISISTSSTPPPPLSRFYSQGVLSAPRSFLFPKLCNKLEHKKVDVENPPHRSQLRQLLESSVVNFSVSNSPHRIGILSSFSSSPPHTATYICDDSDSSQRYVNKDKVVYISNPIYDNHVAVDTPFETPDTSPSRLDTLLHFLYTRSKLPRCIAGLPPTDTISGSSGDNEDDGNAGKSCTQAKAYVTRTTPPLTPMKKLPAQACSVSLTDARSFNTSVTDSNIHNNNNGETSSSSGSPCSSPSW